MLKPSQRLPALSSVWIPDVMRLNDNVTPAGQTAGFLGKQWEPERFVGDPALPKYHIQGLGLAGDLTKIRVDRRRDLLSQLDRSFGNAKRSEAVEAWDRFSHHAFDLVTSGKARAAFDLSQETEKTRDRFGRYTWGQSVLLARRLIEAGVRLVHVNWARRAGRLGGRQPSLGHPRPERRPASGLAVPDVRRHVRRADDRPRRPRPS